MFSPAFPQDILKLFFLSFILFLFPFAGNRQGPYGLQPGLYPDKESLMKGRGIFSIFLYKDPRGIPFAVEAN